MSILSSKGTVDQIAERYLAATAERDALRAENERLRVALDQVRSVVRPGIPVDREDVLAAWRRLEAACQT